MVASKLIFEMHIKTVLARENKSIGLLCKSPRSSLVTSEFFVKFHLDKGDKIFNQAFNSSFH